MRYILVDGHLVPNSPEVKRWHQRAARAVPRHSPSEPQEDPVIDLTDRRTDYQIIESLDETPEI